jgi:uncharacterized protein
MADADTAAQRHPVAGAVAWLALAPVKGMRLQEVGELELLSHGARGDRRFLLTDGDAHLVNGKRLGALVQLSAEWDEADQRLAIRFPDDTVVSDRVALGEEQRVFAYGESRVARPVLGSLSAVISAWAGTEVMMVQPVHPGDGVDRRSQGGVTLLSTASLDALTASAGVSAVDRRRFRMTIGLSDVAAFAEESWLGLSIRLGEAVVRLNGNVGRCAVTTQDPESGRVDLPTLHLLANLRDGVACTEPLPFGVWGEVTTPGRVRLGDSVTPLDGEDTTQVRP